MIEIGPEIREYIEYDIAWLYCLTLSHNGYKDWRLPTSSEYMTDTFSFSWFEERPESSATEIQTWNCYPVRDVT